MTKHKVSDLTGELLDAAEALAEGLEWCLWDTPARLVAGAETVRGCWIGPRGALRPFMPSTEWDQAGPIIEREQINLQARDGGFWQAHYNGGWSQMGDTSLIAAMRAYVASKLGAEVELQ